MAGFGHCQVDTSSLTTGIAMSAGSWDCVAKSFKKRRKVDFQRLKKGLPCAYTVPMFRLLPAHRLVFGGRKLAVEYQKRSGEPAPEAKAALARRATDTHLRGLQVQDEDSDLAWQEWQDALTRQEADNAPTQPSPLE